MEKYLSTHYWQAGIKSSTKVKKISSYVTIRQIEASYDTCQMVGETDLYNIKVPSSE